MSEEYWRASPVQRAKEVNSVPVLLLDGAMGTWLEDEYKQVFDESKPAWSSSADLQYIHKVHGDYLSSGADIILTATYQATPENMVLNSSDAEHSLPDAEARMRDLVAEAKSSINQAVLGFSAPSKTYEEGSRLMPAVALSLSAYGGTMKPSTEYTGEYPEDMTNSASLSNWHEKRLAVYARRNPGEGEIARQGTEYVWDFIQYVAFETLVSVSEVVAVGLAMGSLQRTLDREGRGHTRKRFWICVNYPDRPDGRLLTPCGDTPDEVVQAMLTPPANSDGWSRPWGIGINCTKIHKISQLVLDYERALSKVRSVDKTLAKPWLVVYPDGASNLRYDPDTKKWDPINSENHEGNGRSWAEQMMAFLEEVTQRAEWAGILVGGCCKTTPLDIRNLAVLIGSSS